ncbi:MAG: hypothetical protein ACFFCS_09985 [Candidatus Hodarchaeota archaeon]
MYASKFIDRAMIPDWNAIRVITDDLRFALDSIDEANHELLHMRVRISRAIATMRAEKMLEM